MKTQDFIFPHFLESKRKIILKGIVYECQGTLVMATETTCSLTKTNFKGICVGFNDAYGKNEITIVGSEVECMIVNYNKTEQK